MKIHNPILRKILAGLWYGFASLLVLAALLLTAARVLLPYVDSYRQEIEAVASERTGQPVRIGEMKAEWRGFTPYLVFSDIDLLDDQAQQSLLHFTGASVGIHPWRSLYEQTAVISNLSVRGVDLHIIRHNDGRIEILGLSDKTRDDTAAESAAIANWLFSQPGIGIEKSQLAWTDRLRGHETLVFSDVRLQLRNDKERHQLEGDIVLPERYGKSLTFALDITGEVLQPRNWVGSLYARGVDLQTHDLAGVLTLSELSLQSASVDIEAWTKWDKSKLQSLEGRLQAEDIKLALGEETSALNKVSLGLKWLRGSNGWKLQSEDIKLVTDKSWPGTRFIVNKNTTTGQYDIELSFLRLDDTLPVVVASGATGKLAAQLRSMNPVGDLHNIHVRYKHGGELSIASRLQDIAFSPWRDIPGVANLNGNINGTQEKGTFELNSDALVLDAPEVFRDTLSFQEFSAKSRWSLDDSGYHLDVTSFLLANRDVSTEGRVRFDFTGKADGPYIDLAADLQGRNGENTPRYLPAGVMNKDAVKWLDQAIKAGSVPEGNIVLKGPVAKFPFHNDEGRFETNFKVVDGILNYQQDWPVIRDIEADVMFDGPGLFIRSNKGRIFDTSLNNVEVRIPDVEIDIPVVSFKGESAGSTSDALKYVLESGIAGKREKGLEQLDVSGNTAITLAMEIPLDESVENRVEGSFTFEDSVVSLKDSEHALNAVNGKVTFKDTDFVSRGIKASLFDKPIVIDVDSHLPGNEEIPAAAVRIRGHGDMDLNALLRKKIDKEIPVFIEGEDRWQITLRIPEDLDDEPHWSVSSRMFNSVVALPAPLIKQKGEPRSLELAGTLPEDNIMMLWLQYGKVANGVFSVDTANHFVPLSGELHFGELPATLPDKPGLVVRGDISEISIDAWQNWFETRFEGTGADKDFFPVRDVNLVFAKLRYGQYVLNNVNISGSKTPADWVFDTDSDQVTGRITVPLDSVQRSINLQFTKLRIPKSADSQPTGLTDPREIPAVDMRVERFFYDDREYGQLELALVPQAGGSAIETFRLDSPALLIDASGDWLINANLEQTTRLNAKMTTNDLGKALETYGFARAISKGRTRADAQFEWSGGPGDFSVNNLEGTMNLDIRKGQIVDVEPGAGRIFGILSLATLPRRLTLDFSDLFSKGFSFDVIKGDFTFDQGDAYTTDLYLDGPAARIDVSGRIGLENEDYDQLVTVTPKLTSSLPVAGALVGGPVAGGVLFAVEKLFGRSIDRISQYQYTMTGSWKDPLIEPLNLDADQAGTSTKRTK